MPRRKNYTVVEQFPSSTDAGKLYVVKKDETGALSCNCPVWVFKKTGARTCSHVEEVQGRAVQKNLAASIQQLQGGSLGEIFGRLRKE